MPSTNQLKRRFDLAPLEGFSPQSVLPPTGHERLPLFLLALAAVFNDLKGVFELDEIRRRAMAPPKRWEMSPHSGQMAGLETQLTRILFGLLHELLILLAEYESEASGPEIETFLAKARPKTRKQWKELIETACERRPSKHGQLAKAFAIIRNKAAFHYADPKLLGKGYRTFFFVERPSRQNAAAYASLGSNMQQTRFFYVDAAYTALLRDQSVQLGGGKQFQDRVWKLTDGVITTLSYIVRSYLSTHTSRDDVGLGVTVPRDG